MLERWTSPPARVRKYPKKERFHTPKNGFETAFLGGGMKPLFGENITLRNLFGGTVIKLRNGEEEPALRGCTSRLHFAASVDIYDTMVQTCTSRLHLAAL